MNANSHSEYNSSNNSMIRKNNERIKKIETHLNIEKNRNLEEKFYGFIPTPSNSQYSKNEKISSEDNNKKNLFTKEIKMNNDDDYSKADKFNHKKFKTLSPIKMDNKIRDISSQDETEYKKLENQIKEMQNQINNMNTDFTGNKELIPKCYGLNDEEKEFAETEKINKPMKLKEKLFDFPLSDPSNNKNNNEENKKSYEIFNKEYSEVSKNYKIIDSKNNIKNDTEISSHRNKKDLNFNSYDLCPNENFNKIINENDNLMNMNVLKETSYKIQHIEEKILKIENDVSEMKRNFEKMQDCILKFIETANENNLKVNNNNEPIINPNSIMSSNQYENKLYHNEISISENKNIKYKQNDIDNFNKNYNYISQRTNNTQISKISSNEFPKSQLQASYNDLINHNNYHGTNYEFCNLHPTEMNKLKSQKNYFENIKENKSNTSCGYYDNNNMNNLRVDNNNNIYRIDDPKYIRNEELKENYGINLQYNDNLNRKIFNSNDNLKRYNRYLDVAYSNEDGSNNITSGNEFDFESSNQIKFLY